LFHDHPILFEFAFKFVHTLAHSGQADPVSALASRSRANRSAGYTGPIISYFQNYLFQSGLKDANLRSARVAMYIRQVSWRTRKSAISIRLGVALERLRYQLYLDPVRLAKALDVHSAAQAKRPHPVVRVQQVRHGANFFDGLIRQGGNLGAEAWWMGFCLQFSRKEILIFRAANV